MAIQEIVRHDVKTISDHRIQIWARLRLGGERGVDLAKEFGYRDGSGVLRVAQRLETQSHCDKKLAKKLSRIRKKVSLANVEGVLPGASPGA